MEEGKGGGGWGMRWITPIAEQEHAPSPARRKKDVAGPPLPSPRINIWALRGRRCFQQCPGRGSQSCRHMEPPGSLPPPPHTGINKIRWSRRKGSPDSQCPSWILFCESVVTSPSHVVYHCNQLDPFPEFFFVWPECSHLPTRGRSLTASWGRSSASLLAPGASSAPLRVPTDARENG